MDDQELDALVASVASTDDTSVAPLGFGDMMLAIRAHASSDSGSAQSLETVFELQPPPRTTHGMRGRWLAAAAVAAIATTAIATTGVVLRNRADRNDSASPAAAAAPGRTGPNLLLTAAGWTVTRADEDSDIPGIGEMEFTNGRNRASLMWRPVELHQGYVDDRAHSADSPAAITIDGHQGVLFRYTGANDFTALWLDDKASLELRVDVASEAAYRTLAATLQTVDAASWLAALPASAVRPADRAKVIGEMLAGVQVPDETDKSRWYAARVADRYQLGAVVAGSVACTWLDQWVAADVAGDAAAKTRATAALRGMKSWPIMVELEKSGHYAQVALQYADDAVADASSMRSREYAAGLGCARFTEAGNTWPPPTYMPSPQAVSPPLSSLLPPPSHQSSTSPTTTGQSLSPSSSLSPSASSVSPSMTTKS